MPDPKDMSRRNQGETALWTESLAEATERERKGRAHELAQHVCGS